MSTPRERIRPIVHHLDVGPIESSSPRVVLVCFDVMGRRTLVAAASDGADLIAAADSDALHRALRDPVDAVVCDARMEPTAALAALALVRKHDWALPALVLVSRLDSETAAEAHRIGATSILRAPFTAIDVLDAITAMR